MDDIGKELLCLIIRCLEEGKDDHDPCVAGLVVDFSTNLTTVSVRVLVQPIQDRRKTLCILHFGNRVEHNFIVLKEFVVLHRITFTYRMSKIICMSEGCVAEIGAPGALQENPKSLYKEMYDLNTAKYIKNNFCSLLQ